jgi:hypothetical protein
MNRYWRIGSSSGNGSCFGITDDQVLSKHGVRRVK